MFQFVATFKEFPPRSFPPSFVQPFVNYTTFGIKWTVPVNLLFSRIIRIGHQPISLQAGPRYYVESPVNGPRWGARFQRNTAVPRTMRKPMKPIHSSLSISRRIFVAALAGAPVLVGPLGTRLASAQSGTDPLPSWNDGATKKAITDFVARVTAQGGPDFVPADRRIGTFDNDGTLWSEQPMYVQCLPPRPRQDAGAAATRAGKPSSRSRQCWTAT